MRLTNMTRRIPAASAALLPVLLAACGGGGGGGGGDDGGGGTGIVHHMVVSGVPSTIQAGATFDMQVTLVDNVGAVVPRDGTIVTIAPVAPLAVVFGPTSAATAAGVATFSGMSVHTVGTGYRIRASTAGVSSVDSAGFEVTPASAAGFALSRSGPPASIGVATNVTVRALDVYGNLATGYAGTVRVTSSDAGATLPGDYAFAPADAGVHAFSITFSQGGAWTVTATDTAAPAVTGQTTVPVAAGWPVINEVFYDSVSVDAPNVFIELYGPAGVDLSSLTLVAYNGSDGQVYDTIVLTGTMPADSYYVIATPSATPGLAALADQFDAGADLQNGPDALRLVKDYGLPTEEVLDAVVYGSPSLVDSLAEGAPTSDVAPGSSIARIPDGLDTDDNATDFAILPVPTPGVSNGS